MAVLSVVNLPLGLELEFPNDWLPELERVRRGFKKRDYMAMVEIGYAAYADLFTSGIENPSVKDACGFAHAVGVASGAIGQAIHFRESRRPGGKGRANKIANTEQLVISKAQAVEGWASKSADKLADEILGMDGMVFSHRKVADTIREYRKKQGA